MPSAVSVQEGFTFYHPVSGAGLDLNDFTSYKVLQHEGFGIGDFEHYASASPELHGEYWHGIRFGTKIVTLDMLIIASGLSDLEDKKRQLALFLNPSLTDVRENRIGKLRITQVNGTVRELECVLHEKMEFPTSQHIAQHHARYLMRFRSVKEPFFYEISTQTVVYAGTSDAGFRVPFRLPLRVSSSGIFQSPLLLNDGDAEAPVSIDIEGPATGPIIDNITLDRRLAFQKSGDATVLTAGQHLVIDTDPLSTSVKIDGVNAWNKLSQAEFWGLGLGNNQLSFDIGGSTAATRVTLAYRRRYISV